MYTDTTITKEQVSTYFQSLQDRICRSLENLDGAGKFQEDAWQRPGGGGGRSRVIEGAVIEKGGVNFSAVHGTMPEKIAKGLQMDSGEFFATGVSIVLHPKSPMVPIIHMNVRYFEANQNQWWFGGGIDLTPHYVVKEDAQYFHRQLKKVCDQHHTEYYLKFKKWADDYFYVRHRKETRGIGGVFFDRLSGQDGFTKEDRFAFVKAIGEEFAPIYTHLVTKNKELSYGQKELSWQRLRRGRYVEFNLVWDRGTKFGLETDGRTESILMSLPPQANWVYDYQAKEGSLEAETLSLLKKDIAWAS
ncbi:MAG: oxygen-dependent coproporphyrinogen oxidase [Bacteroidota bacterium]